MGSPQSQMARCDTHVHTKMCGHAVGEMEDYVIAALNKGLDRIIFLEHMEEGIFIPQSSWLSEDDFDYYFAEGKRLQENYRGRIEIGLGVECGYNPSCKEKLQQRLKKRSWDQIGISCHFLQIEGESDHLNLLSKKPESMARANQFYTPELFSRYLDVLFEAITELDGTVLCHLDAAFRWVSDHALTNEHYQKIDTLLEVAAKKKMALEINTSGITIRNDPFPNSRILTMAQEHGMVIQLGSDAHKPADVGNYFDRF